MAIGLIKKAIDSDVASQERDKEDKTTQLSKYIAQTHSMAQARELLRADKWATFAQQLTNQALAQSHGMIGPDTQALILKAREEQRKSENAVQLQRSTAAAQRAARENAARREARELTAQNNKHVLDMMEEQRKQELQPYRMEDLKAQTWKRLQTANKDKGKDAMASEVAAQLANARFNDDPALIEEHVAPKDRDRIVTVVPGVGGNPDVQAFAKSKPSAEKFKTIQQATSNALRLTNELIEFEKANGWGGVPVLLGGKDTARAQQALHDLGIELKKKYDLGAALTKIELDLMKGTYVDPTDLFSSSTRNKETLAELVKSLHAGMVDAAGAHLSAGRRAIPDEGAASSASGPKFGVSGFQ